MHPRGMIEQKGPGMPASVMDYICYKNNRSALQEIRFWMGDNRFLEFLTMFAGSYLVLPSSVDIRFMYYDYLAALSILRIKEARKKKDLMVWNQQESTLHKIAKKTKRKYKNVYLRGVKVLKELEKTRGWIKGLKVWEKKYLKQEDDRHEAPR